MSVREYGGHGDGDCRECGNTVGQDICDGVSLFLT